MKILEQCTKNTDDFSWKELNCYHKPFATAFKAYNEIFFDAYTLLVSYLSVYAVKNNQGEEYTFPEMYRIYLQDFFDLKVKKTFFTDKVDMLLKIKDSIDEGSPIVIPVDIYELKYNPMYKLENHYKVMVIKGYDFSRELIYILDNCHEDLGSSTILSDFVSDFDEMYNMAVTYGKFYEHFEDNKSYFYSIRLQNDKVKSLSYLEILHMLKRILLRTQLTDGINEKIYVRSPELKLLKHINGECSKSKDLEVDRILMNVNFKKVFYKTLSKIIYMYNQEFEKKITSKAEQIEKMWDEIKFKLVFKISRKSTNYDDVQQSIDQVTMLEKEFYSELITYLDCVEKQGDLIEKKQEILGFNLKNNNKAQVNALDEKIIVKLEDKQIYDLWTGSDNAVQLLCKDSENIRMFQIQMNITGALGNAYQSGIVIKLANGKKILFGSTYGSHISIYVPDLKDKFEVYHKLDENALKNVILKVKIESEEIKFIHVIDCNEVCISTLPLEDSVFEIGMYVKSWIKTKCEVEFSNILCQYK